MSMEVDSPATREAGDGGAEGQANGGDAMQAADGTAAVEGAAERDKGTTAGSPLSIECTPIYSLQGHKRSISSLAISPDGTELASSGADGLLKIWSLASGALLVTLDVIEATGRPASQRMGISDVAWSRDGQYIVCGGDDRLVRVWDARRHTLLCELEGHTSFVFCVTFNPDVSLAVSGGFDETVRMWDLQRKRCHRTIAAHSEAVTGVDYNRDGSVLASCSYDGLIRLWDAFTGQCIKTLVHGEAPPIGHVAFSPNAFQLLATSLDNTIRLWDMANGRVLKTYAGHQNAKYALKAAFTAWRQAGHQLPSSSDASNSTMPCMVVSGSEDQRVYLWDLQTKRVLHTLQGHRDVVLSISVSSAEYRSKARDRELRPIFRPTDACIQTHHRFRQLGPRSLYQSEHKLSCSSRMIEPLTSLFVNQIWRLHQT